MGKKNIIIKEIIEILSRFPAGASIEEIMLAFIPMPRRTLQRWLSKLIAEDLVIPIGSARSRRYRLKSQTINPLTKTHSSLILSSESEKIHNFVTNPIASRNPVSYNRSWLESYQPNITQYLPTQVRQHLRSLGEIQEDQYPKGTFAKTIFARLLVDLSWNSSRLEGNTYSYLDTERLILFGEIPSKKNQQETQMILNHKAAIEFLISFATDTGLNRYTILNLHALLSDNLLPDPAFSGRLRLYPVGISHSSYTPIAIPAVIEECFSLILEKANCIQDPFEQAFFLMVHIPYLQAFEDVNKPTSRLAINIPLIKHNLRPLSFVDVPESLYINGLLGVYELNKIELLRDVFIWAYQRSCARYSTIHHSLAEPDPFRLRYRTQISKTIREIVQHRLSQNEALKIIQHQAKVDICPEDVPIFIELIKQDLSLLHEGNIARYQISLSEYEKWKRHL